MMAFQKNTDLYLFFSRKSINCTAISNPDIAKNACNIFVPFIMIMLTQLKNFFREKKR